MYTLFLHLQYFIINILGSCSLFNNDADMKVLLKVRCTWKTGRHCWPFTKIG